MYSKANNSPMVELMPQARAIRPQCSTNCLISCSASGEGPGLSRSERTAEYSIGLSDVPNGAVLRPIDPIPLPAQWPGFDFRDGAALERPPEWPPESSVPGDQSPRQSWTQTPMSKVCKSDESRNPCTKSHNARPPKHDHF